METNPKSERAKSPHKMRKISHGDPSVHPPMHHARGLDVQLGAKRRILACAHSPSAPEVPPVCVQNGKGELIIYQWKVLPFGRATDPRVFTEMIAPLSGLIHSNGHALFPYIHDMLGDSRVKIRARAARELSLYVLMSAGFIINLDKSVLGLTQDMIHLGARIRSDMGLVTLPQAKTDRIITVAKQMLTQDGATARQFLTYTGLMTARMPMIQNCLFRTRPLTLHLLDHYWPRGDSLNKLIPMGSTYLREASLFWTVQRNLERGVPLGPQSSNLIISTDAFLLGWARVYGQPRTRAATSTCWK